MTVMWKRTNIWFFCPACDKRLVVDVQAGGYRADCPECGKNIPIPTRSTAWSPAMKRVGLYAGQAALIALAITIGWWFAAPGPAEDPPAVAVARVPSAAADAKAEPVAAVAPESEEAPAVSDRAVHRQLLEDHAALQGRYNKMLQWMVDNYRGKYPLPERLVGRLRLAPLTENGEVHPDLIEMLRLSDDEKGLVQDVMVYVGDRMRQMEQERARVAEQSDTRITFSVPPFAEAGGELREDLYLALESTLGEHRFDRMVEVAGESMRETFHYFGEAARTLTFEVIFPATPGAHPPYLLIRDGWIVPEGESVRLTRVTETAVTELPERYLPYREWLPESVSRYAVP